jgi:ParB family chromosome partitioning protein
MKKAKRAAFLKQYWKIQHGGDRIARPQIAVLVPGKTMRDVANAIGEGVDTTQRLLKLNELIPELQGMVSSGALGQTADRRQRRTPDLL